MYRGFYIIGLTGMLISSGIGASLGGTIGGIVGWTVASLCGYVGG
jgi:hypothetical protein